MRIAAVGISLRFDPSLGIIDGFETGGAAPLHTAPWVGQEAMPDDAAPHLARLRGDFFCAPFGGHEGTSPAHGWPPNSPWTAEATATTITATLEKRVFGARLSKELTLRDGHPFVYQRHVFRGGSGCVPVANHANVSLPAGGVIRTSPKRWWGTPTQALEPDPARGRSALQYPARGAAEAFPGHDGPCDISRFPWAPAHEDFVMGIEAAGHGLGWTAVTRLGQGDLFLSLRNTSALPMTMLWHSHGGRDYAPWSGRHRHCLGVEEGAAAGMLDLSEDEPLAAPGCLALGGQVEVRHVIGAVPWPNEAAVETIMCSDDTLTVRGADGHIVTVGFDVGFLGL